MPCFNPIQGYRSKIINESGKRSIVFNVNDGYRDLVIKVPCDQCIGCRLTYSREWAIRCWHEAQMHEDNSFLTLTYNDKHLPKGNTLIKKDLQLFIKRLRHLYPNNTIRYYGAGEYGDENGRPHYHLCLFGLDFHDKTIFYKTDKDITCYTSTTLTDIWGKGFCTLGSLNFETAAYTARYVCKKIKGKLAESHYGERLPEFALMSRRPGIGTTWLEKYAGDIYPRGYITIRKKIRTKIPKFYEAKYNLLKPETIRTLKYHRMIKGMTDPENEGRRLDQKHKIQKHRAKMLERSLK